MVNKLRKLTSKEERILHDQGVKTDSFMLVKKDYESITVMDIRTSRVLLPIRY